MISYKKGVVELIKEEDKKIQWLKVYIDDELYNAVNYIDLTDRVKVGEEVMLNTTAVELSLGTGGEHFVMANLSKDSRELNSKAHIMKLKYTPVQTQVLSVEAQESEYHNKIKEFKSLDGSIFITGTLHSNLLPIAAYIKKNRPKSRINYIKEHSEQVLASKKDEQELKKRNIKLIEDNYLEIKNGYVRHNALHLSQKLLTIADYY